MDRAIAYYRASTRRQGRSGLGIEAQRAAVTRFAEGEGISIIAEYVEAESGKGSGGREPVAQRFSARAGRIRVERACELFPVLLETAGLLASETGVLISLNHFIRQRRLPRGVLSGGAAEMAVLRQRSEICKEGEAFGETLSTSVSGQTPTSG